jgi:hypothetical protein
MMVSHPPEIEGFKEKGSAEKDAPVDRRMRPARLGRLERHDLRTAWVSEASDFTPWLARPENIALLGDALGLRLEVEAQEKTVGQFRADLLCRDIDTEQRVMIENQLERTNHVHLGQILTYAAGLEAVTIVWVAARFTDEHRATLDWLNRVTNDNVRLFGLEVELWRIGDSAAAPKFNIICKPNAWSHSVARAARAIEETELSDLRLLQQEYWAGFLDTLNQTQGLVVSDKKPQPQYYMNFPIGRNKVRLNVAMIRPRSQIRVAINLCGVNAKLHFRLLQAQRQEIERDFGHPLEWHEMPDGQESRIAYYLNDADAEDRADWPRQHQWLAEHANALYRAFSSRVGCLNPDNDEVENDVA